VIKCKGHWIHNVDGSDFDCEYKYAGEITCDSCIINGGDYSPQTGKLFRGNKKKYIKQARFIGVNL